MYKKYIDKQIQICVYVQCECINRHTSSKSCPLKTKAIKPAHSSQSYQRHIVRSEAVIFCHQWDWPLSSSWMLTPTCSSLIQGPQQYFHTSCKSSSIVKAFLNYLYFLITCKFQQIVFPPCHLGNSSEEICLDMFRCKVLLINIFNIQMWNLQP